MELSNFTTQALAPHIFEWCNTARDLHNKLINFEFDEHLKDFYLTRDYLEREIRDLKKEKSILVGTAQEQEIIEKNEFLNELKDKPYIEGATLSDTEKEWLTENGYKKSYEWCINKK